ncbi:MAG: hypothetical protein AAF039_08180 [Bacteroidota bacterium]
MNILPTRPGTILRLTCWTLFFQTAFYGQQIKEFSGERSFGTYQGQAEYEYRIEGIDTILEGGFTFQKSNLNALLRDNDSTFYIAGEFKGGVPQGNWTFQFGEFYSDSVAQVTGFQYRLNVTGISQEAKGFLDQGKPDGTWKISQKKIKDSQVLDTLFFSEINFLDGVPQQSFTVGNAQGTLVGRFLRNGLAHDTWSLFSNEAYNVENWFFTDGWLEKIEANTDGVPFTIGVFNNRFNPSKIMALDKGYSTLVSIYANHPSSSAIDLSTGINELLVQNSSNYKKIEEILSELGSNEFLEGFKVKAPYFPLDSISRKELNTTVNLTARAIETSKGFLENTRLNLIKRSDEEANTLYHTIAALDSSFLRPLGALMELENLGITESLSEEMLSNYLFPKGRPSPQLVIVDDNGNAKDFLGPGGDLVDFEAEGMPAYLAIAEYVSQSLEQIKVTLGQKLEDDKQQQEFVLLEEQMIAQVNAMNQFPDSTLQRLSKMERRALDNIKSKTEALLSEYAEMPTGDEKLNRARMLISCLLDFDALSQQIVKLPLRSEELREKYTDAVFNPFTATIMDESVKKRITSAYNNVLVPYMLEKVEKELNCEDAKGLQLLFQKSFERMVELREEDTSKMERKLRKERNPKVVLQLFNLKALEE